MHPESASWQALDVNGDDMYALEAYAFNLYRGEAIEPGLASRQTSPIVVKSGVGYPKKPSGVGVDGDGTAPRRPLMDVSSSTPRRRIVDARDRPVARWWAAVRECDRAARDRIDGGCARSDPATPAPIRCRRRTRGSRTHDDGTIVDRQSKLMWTRCSVGQQWSDGRCSGDARAYDFRSASSMVDDVNRNGTLFFSDWRMPARPRARDDRGTPVRQPAHQPRDLSRHTGRVLLDDEHASARSEGFAFALSFGTEGIRYLDKDQVVHLRLVRDAR